MPKELRKRGKRHKKSSTHQTPSREQEPSQGDDSAGGPSWIVAREVPKQLNPEAPFGYVDPELKAYFRTVDDQLKEWQQNWGDATDGEEDIDPNESASCLFSFPPSRQ
jgi:nucleolar protein 9